MTDKKQLSDYTEGDFLKLVSKIYNAEGETEQEDEKNILEFIRLCEHPAGSDLIFYP